MEDRRRRCWSFAGCLFDEGNWTLAVDGQRVAIEAKPLELLRELLLNAGNLVSKDELLDRVWPDVAVVEASLPTAIGKLRRALHDDRRDKPIIETVPRIGYRLAVPVEVEDITAAPDVSTAAPRPPGAVPIQDNDREGIADSAHGLTPIAKYLPIAGALAIASAAIALGLGTVSKSPAPTAASRPYTHRDIFVALRKVDVERIDQMIVAGWNPNAPLDEDRNNALNVLLDNCEWDPGHDQRRMLMMARTLVDGGVDYSARNAWGDTAYSIAVSKRFCGPDHPVTKMIARMCSRGVSPIPKNCLADYHRDAKGVIQRQ